MKPLSLQQGHEIHYKVFLGSTFYVLGTVFSVNSSPECLQSSGRPVAIGARRAVPSRGPFCCEIADLPNGQALARLTE